MKRWTLSGRASEDLLEAFEAGIENFGLSQAETYSRGLQQIFDLLAAFPGMARERVDFDPPIRIHHHGRHYIAYLVQDNQVLIVRVIHDNADLDRLFGRL